jgi:hypothetical protein
MKNEEEKIMELSKLASDRDVVGKECSNKPMLTQWLDRYG